MNKLAYIKEKAIGISALSKQQAAPEVVMRVERGRLYGGTKKRYVINARERPEDTLSEEGCIGFSEEGDFAKVIWTIRKRRDVCFPNDKKYREGRKLRC